jgi:hypothetical protein
MFKPCIPVEEAGLDFNRCHYYLTESYRLIEDVVVAEGRDTSSNVASSAVVLRDLVLRVEDATSNESSLNSF